MKWDMLVLTAGTPKQKRAFELQLLDLNYAISPYFEQVQVIADEPCGVKIGSGGSTLNVLSTISTPSSNKRTLILHSGGYSQRLPHVSALGKLFMLLPDGRCLLQHKLEAYQPLLEERLPPGGGVFIGASDTLEYFGGGRGEISMEGDEEVDLLLIAHESTLETAQRHGVYVLDQEGGQLRCVLQKPTLYQLKENGALLPNNHLALTDSCYWMGPRLVEKLLQLREMEGPPLVELCAYGDFLRPLGSAPLIDYCSLPSNNNHDGGDELTKWRQLLLQVMSKRRAHLLNLGQHSFFHFGTWREFLHYSLHCNQFKERFMSSSGRATNVVYSHLEATTEISPTSFIEWSTIRGRCRVEEGCILSGVEISETDDGGDVFIFTANRVYITLVVGEGAYVTAIFKRDEDLKVRRSGSELSLWEEPLFPIRATAEGSLRASMSGGRGGDRMSIKAAIESTDVEMTLRLREQLSGRAAQIGDPTSATASTT